MDAKPIEFLKFLNSIQLTGEKGGVFRDPSILADVSFQFVDTHGVFDEDEEHAVIEERYYSINGKVGSRDVPGIRRFHVNMEYNKEDEIRDVIRELKSKDLPGVEVCVYKLNQESLDRNQANSTCELEDDFCRREMIGFMKACKTLKVPPLKARQMLWDMFLDESNYDPTEVFDYYWDDIDVFSGIE